MATLAENRYGKARVRLVKVIRHSDGHELREWSLRILFEGDFETCFTTGDNSRILPTDTMKNTVYSRARNSSAATIEEFATELATYFLDSNPQASAVSVVIEERPWDHIAVDGAPYPTAFQRGGGELRTTSVSVERGQPLTIASGIKGLVILKTAHSGFTGYIKDRLTTLPETTDRLFGTEVSAEWAYSGAVPDYAAERERIRQALVGAFARHDSLSVQHTLYAIGEAVLAASPAVDRITLAMPNLHCLLVDLSRFGQDNPNEIFVPTDEPHGSIEATIRR